MSQDASQGSKSKSEVKAPKQRSLKNLKSKRKMSLLEKLPTEILEFIFIYSMNFDLPRSSPILAGKLSSQALFTKTIFAGFRATWDKEYGHNRALWTVDMDGPDTPSAQVRIVTSTTSLYLIIASPTFYAADGQLSLSF
jgi:hypothetical protein